MPLATTSQSTRDPANRDSRLSARRSKKQGLRTAGRATQRCFLKRQQPCCWLPARRRGGGQSSKGWAGLFISPVVIIIRRCWRWAHNHVFVGLSDSVLGAFGFLSNARWSDAGRHARSRRQACMRSGTRRTRIVVVFSWAPAVDGSRCCGWGQPEKASWCCSPSREPH